MDEQRMRIEQQCNERERAAEDKLQYFRVQMAAEKDIRRKQQREVDALKKELKKERQLLFKSLTSTAANKEAQRRQKAEEKAMSPLRAEQPKERSETPRTEDIFRK